MEKQKQRFAAILVFGGIAFYFGLTHFNTVTHWASALVGLCTPAVIGGIIAFLLNVPMTAIENGLKKLIYRKHPPKPNKALRMVSLLLTFVCIIVVVALAVITRQKTGLPLGRASFKPRRDILGPILKVGVPVALQDGFIQVSFILITIIANNRGLNDAAAVGIVEKVISFVFLVPSSMLSTVSALAAQNAGAGKDQRAAQTLRYAVTLCVGFGLAVGIAVQFLAGNIVAVFDSTPAVVEAGSQYIRGYIWDCMFAGVHFSFSGYFCAYGKSGISFLHNALSIVLVRIPGAYFMSQLFPATLLPMGCAAAAGSCLSVIVCVIAFVWLRRQGKLAGAAA